MHHEQSASDFSNLATFVAAGLVKGAMGLAPSSLKLSRGRFGFRMPFEGLRIELFLALGEVSLRVQFFNSAFASAQQLPARHRTLNLNLNPEP